MTSHILILCVNLVLISSILNTDLSEDNSSSDNLLCDEPVKIGLYDHLEGIQNRASHPNISETEEMLELFKEDFGKWPNASLINVNTIGQRLRASKLKKPDYYIWRGNYWRMKGDTLQAIQCYRMSLEVSPRNSNALLYLGRILLKVEYFDDAIFVTKKSLKFREVRSNGWKQHFQLGEIEVATGNLKEAVVTLRRAQRLRPDHEPLKKMVRDIERKVFCQFHMGPLTFIAIVVFSMVMRELYARNRQLWFFAFPIAMAIILHGEIISIYTCFYNVDDWSELLNKTGLNSL